jgi:hypothetical protein
MQVVYCFAMQVEPAHRQELLDALLARGRARPPTRRRVRHVLPRDRPSPRPKPGPSPPPYPATPHPTPGPPCRR